MRLTKTTSDGTEVHEAAWQGTAGVAGTTTITRYGGKWNQETGLVTYSRRAYRPSTGSWLSRDPLEEEGGENVYAMVSKQAQ